MKSTIIFLLLVPVCWAKPFQTGLFDFMLEDEASGVGPTDSSFDPRYDLEPLGPVCPFRCQCHLRVVQCSDLELGTNPLKSTGIDPGTFGGMKKLSYIRISDTNITSIPRGLPVSLTELHLDGNKITKVEAANLKGLNSLTKLGLSFNSISAMDNGSLANTPRLRELHLDNNKLLKVPGGLAEHKYIQVVYLHNNNISTVGTNDFCPPGYNTKKASYSGVSLFSNPVRYWEIQPSTFRCVYERSAIQLGNYK
ncbi:decorin isoform X3 [Sarcophilus harrisii]|uniref:decorin isoform X3 n=1 Tax=Sarcophilus harrisii TaxID=9305 RepID=UPI001301AEC9|nr:decorin isoform X3 [Sarcophilus harrisii]